MKLPGDGIAVSDNQPERLQPGAAELRARVAALESRLSECESNVLRSGLPTLLYRAGSLEVLDANDAALSFLGVRRHELIGQDLRYLLTPSESQERQDSADRLSRPSAIIGPIRLRFSERGEVPARLTTFSFDPHSGDTRIALLQRQTSGDLAEDALRASEERYRDLFENANDIIFLHDLKGKLLDVNRAAEAMTGYSRSELLGEDFGILLSPEAWAHMQDSIRAHLGGSPTQHYELPIVSKTGVERFLEVSTRVLYERGHPTGVQGIGRDITERKLSERQLLESSRQLQIKNEELSKALRLAREATQLKEQFLANTSHELRTPLNGIMGMTNLLRDTRLAEEQMEYVDAVGQCANDLLTIINDLLDMSQIEAGRLSIAMERFDIRESIASVAKMLRLKAGGKGLELTCNVDSAVPATMVGDSVRFRQILVNLVANAIKFTPAGAVRVYGELTDQGRSFLCRVVDSGIGVEEAIRDRIFEAFFQADGTLRRKYGGTGLGLTISKQLVELQGGQIGTYNNSPEAGATFWFVLPLRTNQVVSPSLDASS